MTEQLYSHVLVPTDYRPGSRDAYRVAFAAARGDGSKVTLLHVRPMTKEGEYTGLDAIRLMHRAAERVGLGGTAVADPDAADRAGHLDRLRAEVPTGLTAPDEVRLEVRRGDVVDEIAKFAAETGVDLIVVAGSRPGLLPSLGASVASRLARATPVKIVRVTPPHRG